MSLAYFLLLLACALVAAFVLANILAAWLFRAFSDRVLTPEEKQRNDYMARFDGSLAEWRAGWFGISEDDWPAFSAEYRAHELNIYAYEPFCEYRHPERHGRFINYSAHGFRHGGDQGAWPPDSDCYVVFVFGGSTTLAVGPDWTTIPSHLQDFLNGSAPDGKRVCVYNFGRGAYFSSLETALFINLLRDGYRCDLAVFIDGINDPFFHTGFPPTAGVYQAAIADMNASIAAATRSARRAAVDWSLFRRFWGTLPLFKLLDLAARWVDRDRGLAAQNRSAPRPPLEAETVDAVIERYLFNMHAVQALAGRHAIHTLHIWQPSPAYRYDLSSHVALKEAGDDLLGHERSSAVYDALNRQLAEKPVPGFVWLADMQSDRAEPLYVDTVHYTDAFCRDIAQRIAEAIRDRELLSDRAAPATKGAQDV